MASPTLCREHLLKLLERFERSGEVKLFILETNRILLGPDRSYVKELSRFKRVHVRVSLKAGTPEAFEARTGVCREFFDLPFKAIEYLLEEGVSFHAAAMTDPRIMPKREREELLHKLKSIDPVVAANLEELCDLYETTLVRMSTYGLDPVKFFRRPSRYEA